MGSVSTGESNEQVLSTLFVSHNSFVSYMGGVITVYDDYLEWTESQTATRLQAILGCDNVADICLTINGCLNICRNC